MAALAPDPVCDDCRKTYEGPAYYTLDPVEDGSAHINPDTLAAEEECTGNLCPDCAGRFLTPDDPEDPRKPTR